MAKAPAMQFYVRDWLADTAVVSLRAAGGWMRILCHLHLADLRGEDSRTLKGWAGILGTTIDEAAEVLQDLAEQRVADIRSDRDMSRDVTFCPSDVTAQYTVVCRRMARERKEREGNRMRKRRERSKKTGGVECHGKVTSPSATASASASAKHPPTPQKRGADTASKNEPDTAKPETPATDRNARRQVQARSLATFYRETAKPGDDTCTPAGRGAKNAGALLKGGHAYDDLQAAVINYAEAMGIKGQSPQYRKNAGNFFGTDGTFEAYLPTAYQRPAPPASGGFTPAGAGATNYDAGVTRFDDE